MAGPLPVPGTTALAATIVFSLLLSGCESAEEKAARFLQLAEQHYSAGDLVRADVELRNALQVQPRNAPARYLMALIDEREQEYPKVLAGLQMAVDADPAFVDARIKLGNYYVLGNKLREAREQADVAVRLAPSSSAAHLLNARVYFIEDRPAQALEAAGYALTLDAGRIDARTLQASILARQGGIDQALAALDAGVAAADTAGAESLRRARISLLAQAGRRDQAEVELLRLAKEYPDRSIYDLALARLYAQDGRTADAEKHLQSLIAREPGQISWRLQFAGLLARQNRIDEAERSLEEAVRANPGAGDLQLALATFQESVGHADKALALYEAMATSERPAGESTRARTRLIALTARTDPALARKLLAELLTDAPDNVDALIQRAAFSVGDGRYNEAIADLRSALVRQPDSTTALLLLARTHVRAGNAALAEDSYRRLLVRAPEITAARNELAAVVAGRGDLAEAGELLREALQINPADPVLASNLVDNLMNQGDFEAAEAEARRMIAGGEESGLSEYQLGLSLQSQGEAEKASVAYRRALEQNPTAEAPLASLIALLQREGRYTEAEQYLTRLIRLHPGHIAAALLLGRTYLDMGKTDLARQTFRDVIRQVPDDTRGYIALAGSYQADSVERRKALEEGHRQLPGNPQLGLAVGAMHERRGDWEQAIAAYETVVRAGGADDFVVNNLAVLLLDMREDAASHARALELSRRFEQRASHPFNIGVLGWAHYRNGNTAEARRLLERSLAAMDGPAPQLHYYLGMACLAGGDEAQAHAELAQAIREADSSGTSFSGLVSARTEFERLDRKAAGRKS